MIRRCVVLAVSAALLLGACGSSDGKENAAYCDQLKAFRARFVDNTTDLDLSQLKAASVAIDAMVKNAPKAIKADAQTVADAFEFYAQGKNPPDYRTEEIQKASDNVSKFGVKKCGIVASTTTTT